MLFETQAGVWQKVRRTNATDSSFPARIPRKTQPATAATASATSQDVIQVATGANGTGGQTQNIVQMLFYGTGSNNNSFSARLWGWAPLRPFDDDPQKVLWIPTLIFELTSVTLSSTVPGIAGTPIVAAELFADTATLNVGNTSKVTLTSPANDTAGALVEADFTGFPVLEATFSIASGSTTDMNALFRLF